MKSPKATPINKHLLDLVTDQALSAPRKRTNFNFHQFEDKVQRFLNAIEPDSYIRPHRHVNPNRIEVFIVLKGAGAVIVFDDSGAVSEIHILDPKKECWGAEIPGGVFHTILSLEPHSVFYELKPGPYDPNADKGFAEWAPEEFSSPTEDYLKSLRELALKKYRSSQNG